MEINVLYAALFEPRSGPLKSSDTFFQPSHKGKSGRECFGTSTRLEWEGNEQRWKCSEGACARM